MPRNSFSQLTTATIYTILVLFKPFLIYRTMALDSINPLGDPRVKHCYANLDGIQYRMCLLSLHQSHSVVETLY